MKQTEKHNILQKFSSLHVAVLGDIMLDSYLWGQVNRISPEAPVPVLQVERKTCCPGGAGNVLRNLVSLRAGASAFGVVGEDDAGKELRKVFTQSGIDASGILSTPLRRTTQKQRIVAGSQQLLRVDIEDAGALEKSLRRQLTDAVLQKIRSGSLNAVIFDDYAKGVLESSMLEEIIGEASGHNVITVLDPKPKNREMQPVRHLTLLKPNRNEAFALAGESDPGAVSAPEQDKPLRAVAERLLENWEPDELIISLASRGMAIFDRSGKMRVIPTRAREVYDVSGAGDTVAAVCTLALAAGAPPEEAADIANRAAGVVVGKVGTAPILYEELLEAMKN